MNKPQPVMFFHDSIWLKIIEESFKAKTLKYHISGKAYIIQIIPYSFFKFAFPNFPIGVNENDAQLFTLSENIMLDIKKEANFLRITAPNDSFSFHNTSVAINQEQPITEISNLQDWSLANLSSSIKRNVKKSQRNGVQLFEDVTPEITKRIFDIYEKTISRHSGKSKYSEAYFSQLLEATKCDTGAYVVVAKNNKGETIGYMIVVDHNDTAYYLHGGINYQYQKLRVMDALFNYSIQSAQKRGLAKFNMLMSPPDQSSLVRYKEKWGGTTTLVTTSTIAFNPFLIKAIKIINRTIKKP